MRTILVCASLSFAALVAAAICLVQLAGSRTETRALKASLEAALNRPPPPAPPPPPEPPIEVADVMNKLQRYANKLFFAGRHENWKLAEFYVEEIEETAKEFSKKDLMHGQVNISGLMDALIQPDILELERAVSAGDAPHFQKHYNALIKNCNACHTSVNLPFIAIRDPRTPAYDNQNYERVNPVEPTNATPATATVFVEPPKAGTP